MAIQDIIGPLLAEAVTEEEDVVRIEGELGEARTVEATAKETLTTAEAATSAKLTELGTEKAEYEAKLREMRTQIDTELERITG